MWYLLSAGESEPLEKACGGYYGLQSADAPREPAAGRLVSSCSRAPSAWAPCTSHNTPFDFMKIPDICDVMNKFEVLGIVGEGESFRLITTWIIKAHFVYLQSETVTTDPVFSRSFEWGGTLTRFSVSNHLIVFIQFACGTRLLKAVVHDCATQ